MTMHLAMTTAGLAAVTDAENVGTAAVSFTKLAIGAGTDTGDQSARTALIDQKMTEAVTGAASGTTRIALRADYAPTESFAVTEAGLFARVGTGAEFLAAYWVAENAAGALASAANGTALVIAGVVAIESSSADIEVTQSMSVSVGVPDNVVLKTDHASETERGIVELATPAEARAGTDSERAVTPAGLEARIDDIPAAAAPPDASKTRKGLVELATISETQTGTDDARAVTPAGLASRTATTTRKGLVELATGTETAAGADSERAVTPAGLVSRTATTTRKGLVELATSTETKNGTDSERAVTPQGLKSAIDLAGGLTGGTARKSATYNVGTADDGRTIEVDASGGARTVNLPNLGASDDGFTVTVVKTDSGTNKVTIDGNGGDTINGAATYVVENQWEAVILKWTGSAWIAIGGATGGFLRGFFGDASRREFTTAGQHSYTWEWSTPNGLAILTSGDGRGFGRSSTRDIDYTGNDALGVASDGTTVWLVKLESQGAQRRYVAEAYVKATGSRDESKDFIIVGYGNHLVRGAIYTNGNLYFGYEPAAGHNSLLVFNASARARSSGLDIPLGYDGNIRGLATDHTTIWVMRDKNYPIYAFTISSRGANSARNIPVSAVDSIFRIRAFEGLTGSGSYFWVMYQDRDDTNEWWARCLRADTFARAQDFDLTLTEYASSVWRYAGADDGNLWFCHQHQNKLYSFQMPSTGDETTVAVGNQTYRQQAPENALGTTSIHELSGIASASSFSVSVGAGLSPGSALLIPLF